MSSVALKYTRSAAEFADPVGLVGQAYEQIIRALYVAAQAVEQHNIELKTNELNRALAIVSYLESALDRNAGPKVAAHLALFYATMRREILRASAKLAANDLRQVAGYFTTLREAWTVVERGAPRSSARQQAAEKECLSC